MLPNPAAAASNPAQLQQQRIRRDQEQRRRRREALLHDFFTPPVKSSRYQVEKVIGEGAYGVVVSAFDLSSDQKERVAVKRIKQVLETQGMATRILRELKFMRFLQKHENIISLKDVLIPSEQDHFNDIFLVLEIMPTDLGRLLRSKTTLTPQHVRFLMFQLLRAVNFIHSANVFHRDLNPNNILVNGDCQLRVCDFGLARAAFQTGDDNLFWTDYVATRWYRAPELILQQSPNYSTAIDMWSVGCIFAEILNEGRPLFPGRNRSEQFQLILRVTGIPPREVTQRLAELHMVKYLESLPSRQPVPLQTLFTNAEPEALHMLSRMLEFDPDKRITAAEALALPYFDELRHLGLGETTKPLDEREFAFERTRLTAAEMRHEFLREIMAHHPQARDELFGRCGGLDRGNIKSGVPSRSAQFGEAMNATLGGVGATRTTLTSNVYSQINPPNDVRAEVSDYRSATMGSAQLNHISENSTSTMTE